MSGVSTNCHEHTFAPKTLLLVWRVLESLLTRHQQKMSITDTEETEASATLKSVNSFLSLPDTKTCGKTVNIFNDIPQSELYL